MINPQNYWQILSYLSMYNERVWILDQGCEVAM